MEKKIKKYSIISGLGFLICGILNIIPIFGLGIKIYFNGIFDWLNVIAIFVLAVLVLMRIKNNYTIVATGFRLVVLLLLALYGRSTLIYFFNICAAGCLLILSILVCKKLNKTNVELVNKYFYIPAVFSVLSLIAMVLSEYYRWIYRSSIVCQLFYSVAVLFYCMWLNEETKINDENAMLISDDCYTGDTESIVYEDQYKTNLSPELGGADKIKLYKELLDSGIITQEEFDSKKKQILNL